MALTHYGQPAPGGRHLGDDLQLLSKYQRLVIRNTLRRKSYRIADFSRSDQHSILSGRLANFPLSVTVGPGGKLQLQQNGADETESYVLDDESTRAHKAAVRAMKEHPNFIADRQSQIRLIADTLAKVKDCDATSVAVKDMVNLLPFRPDRVPNRRTVWHGFLQQAETKDSLDSEQQTPDQVLVLASDPASILDVRCRMPSPESGSDMSESNSLVTHYKSDGTANTELCTPKEERQSSHSSESSALATVRCMVERPAPVCSKKREPSSFEKQKKARAHQQPRDGCVSVKSSPNAFDPKAAYPEQSHECGPRLSNASCLLQYTDCDGNLVMFTGDVTQGPATRQVPGKAHIRQGRGRRGNSAGNIAFSNLGNIKMALMKRSSDHSEAGQVEQAGNTRAPGQDGKKRGFLQLATTVHLPQSIVYDAQKAWTNDEILPAYWTTRQSKQDILQTKIEKLVDADARMTGGKRDAVSRRPIHVFVDLSNIMIGFCNTLKIRRGIPTGRRMKQPAFSFGNFSRFLIRSRQTAKKVVAGSLAPGRERPTYMLDAAGEDYEMIILQRVKKPASPGLGLSKHAEQGVDELLHLKMCHSVIDNLEQPATIVLATGDAAIAEYSDGFKKNVERALAAGFHVELYTWMNNTSCAWTDSHFINEWGGKFKILVLDSFVEEFFDFCLDDRE